MTDLQRKTLTRFADACDRTGNPASPYEALGSDADELAQATAKLVAAGLLKALPTEETCDDHGGTRFRVTPEGWQALGRSPRPGAKGHGARIVPSANGKRRAS